MTYRFYFIIALNILACSLCVEFSTLPEDTTTITEEPTPWISDDTTIISNISRNPTIAPISENTPQNATLMDLSMRPINNLSALHSDITSELNLTRSCLRLLESNDLGGLPNLKTLHISHNLQLTELNFESESLEALFSTNCSITSPILTGLPNLQVLDLSYNRIVIVSERCFISNVFITTLDLSYNSIAYLEEYTFIRNTRLQDINLSNNKLKAIDWSTTLKSAISLNISYNSINNIDYLMLRNAEMIDLSYNKIENVPEEIGRLLPSVTILNLTGNRMRHIRRLKSYTLTHLKLSECKLTHIHTAAFTEVPEMAYLDVSDNKLKNLEFLRHTGDANTTIVNLDYNQWECTCNFSMSLLVTCEPDNLTLVDFCRQSEELLEDGEPWFMDATNPVVWAPLLAAAVIAMVSCFGYRIYKTRKQKADDMEKMRQHGIRLDLLDDTSNPSLERDFLTLKRYRTLSTKKWYN